MSELMELPNSKAFSFGSCTDMPGSFSFECDFGSNFAVPLLKPAPVEGARPRIVVMLRMAKIDNGTAQQVSDEVLEAMKEVNLVSIYVKGDLTFSGAE